MESVRREVRRQNFERKARDYRPFGEQAETLWEKGEFELCLWALERLSEVPSGAYETAYGAYDSAAIVLRARALIRLRSIDIAREWLAQTATQFADRTGDDAAVHAMLNGQVHAASREFAEAESCFTRARFCNPDSRIAAEIDYCSALSAYQQGNFSSARRLIEGSLQHAPDIVSVRIRALRGLIGTAQERYQESYRDFSRALEAVKLCSVQDIQLSASILYALAVLAAELQLGDPQRLDIEYSKMRWATSLAGERTQMLRHIGLAYLHSGDRDRAITRFVSSTEVAPGTPWSIFGFVEIATVALAQGEDLGPQALARKAMSIAEHIGWKRITGEQRLSLLLLAQLLARMGDAVRARTYRDLYYEHDRGVSCMGALKPDTRLLALERHVEGCVAGALGVRDEACSILETIHEEWLRIGCTFRAREAKEDLDRIDPSRDSYRTSIVRPRLSSRDEQMVSLIIEGKTNQELGEHFHIAVNTVKNTVLKLYSKFNVHNRTQLVVAARGLSSSGRVLS